jgi:hypothetical protein
VPELYAFPPGVLPICLSYLGTNRLFVFEAHSIRIHDDEGQPVSIISGPVCMMTIDHKKGVIYTLHPYYSVRSYSYTGKYIGSFRIAESDQVIDVLTIINGLVCTEDSVYLDSDSDSEGLEHTNDLQRTVTLYQPFDGKIVISSERMCTSAQPNGKIRCELNNTLLAHVSQSLYRGIHGRIQQFPSPFDGSNRKDWRLDIDLDIHEMTSSGDGISVYALDRSKHTIHVLMFR